MIPPERLLDTYLAAKRELQPYERSTDHWTASSLGMCLRRQYLERQGVTPLVTPDARALRRFATGDVFHDFIQSMYADCGRAVGIEVPVKDHDRQLSCRIDLIVGAAHAATVAGKVAERRGSSDGESTGLQPHVAGSRPAPGLGEKPAAPTAEQQTYLLALRQHIAKTFPDSGDVTGVEIKSATPFAMTRLPKDGAYPHHLIQLAACKLAADVQMPGAIHAWRMLYVGMNLKDSFRTIEFPLLGRVVDEAERRLDALNAAWKNQEPPPCTCAETFERKFCAYAEGGDVCCRVPSEVAA